MQETSLEILRLLMCHLQESNDCVVLFFLFRKEEELPQPPPEG